MTNEKLEKFFAKYDLQDFDEKSEEYFCAAVNIAINEYNIDEEDIRKAFGISKPSLERWKSGKNAPHESARKSVLEWIAENI